MAVASRPRTLDYLRRKQKAAHDFVIAENERRAREGKRPLLKEQAERHKARLVSIARKKISEALESMDKSEGVVSGRLREEFDNHELQQLEDLWHSVRTLRAADEFLKALIESKGQIRPALKDRMFKVLTPARAKKVIRFYYLRYMAGKKPELGFAEA